MWQRPQSYNSWGRLVHSELYSRLLGNPLHLHILNLSQVVLCCLCCICGCHLQLCLSFYEPRRRQVGWQIFGKQDERLYWERW